MTQQPPNAPTVFRRREKKYLLRPEDFRAVRGQVAQHMQRDAFHVSHIYNIYFDTAANDLVVQSLETTDYKYKVRFRSYDKNPTRSNLFFEIKSKLNGVVYKRRVRCTLDDYYAYVAGERKHNNDQVTKELNYLFETLHLEPKMFIAYDRYAYKDASSDLRITFDTHLRSRSTNLDIADDRGCENFFDDESYIMEIKTKDAMPLWLTHFLTERQLFSSSFSKYGQIFMKQQDRSLAYA